MLILVTLKEIALALHAEIFGPKHKRQIMKCLGQISDLLALACATKHSHVTKRDVSQPAQSSPLILAGQLCIRKYLHGSKFHWQMFLWQVRNAYESRGVARLHRSSGCDTVRA